MNLVRVIHQVLIFLSALIFIGGCYSVHKDSSVKNGMNDGASKLMRELSLVMEKAKDDQLDFLSPGWYDKAEKAYFNAMKSRDPDDSLKYASLIQTYLEHGRGNSRLVQLHLKNLLAARYKSQAVGVDFYKKEHFLAEEAFKKTVLLVEKNDLRSAKKKASALADTYRWLEINTIKEKNLHKVKAIVRRAEEKGAKKIISKPYKDAISMIRDTEIFIESNPYLNNEIETRTEKTLFMAVRLDSLIDQANEIKKMRAEEVTLWFENVLLQITHALNGKDKRQESFNDQKDQIISIAEKLMKDNILLYQQKADLEKEGKAQVEALQKRIAFLEDKNQRDELEKERVAALKKNAEESLEKERRFRELLYKMQALFTPEDAEIQEQQKVIVIRLKGLFFPVGKSVVLPENYVLLSKVQAAIRVWNKPFVTVEGHTDSTGSKESNLELSHKRAEAIKEYLISQKTISEEKIIARGYGSDHPLVSNESIWGRSINRRIDLRIDPQDSY